MSVSSAMVIINSRPFFTWLVFVVASEVCCSAFENVEDDVKVKLLNLLSSTPLPQIVEDRSLDTSNNFINAPFYKSKFQYEDNSYGYGQALEERFKDSSRRNGKFSIPWLNIEEEPARSREESTEGSSDTSDKEDDLSKNKNADLYETTDDVRYQYVPPQFQHYYEHPEWYSGHNYGYKHNHGSYQGSGLHYHHNYDSSPYHHHHHQHRPGCFPFGNRRPRPPPPRPTQSTTSTTTAFPSIDPRVSTLASLVSTRYPSIDIRVGRDTIRNRHDTDSIVFPTE